MPDELLGSLFDDLGLHKGSEGGHDAEKEMAATSVGSAGEERGRCRAGADGTSLRILTEKRQALPAFSPSKILKTRQRNNTEKKPRLRVFF